jgi:hypothetical protein
MAEVDAGKDPRAQPVREGVEQEAGMGGVAWRHQRGGNGFLGLLGLAGLLEGNRRGLLIWMRRKRVGVRMGG